MALYTETSGSGPDLVMLHGWGLHSGIWEQFVPLLESHFRVTRMDLPGHGRSDWQGASGLDAWVEALLATAPARATWLGWSLGGLLALRAALLAPGRVDALITIASSPCFVRRPDWPHAMQPSLLEAFATGLQQDYSRTLNRFLSLQVHGSEQSGRVLKTLRTSLLAHGEPDAAALSAGLGMLQTVDLRSELGGLDCQTLLLMGERDMLVPLQAGFATVDLLPDAQLAVIAGAGHAPFLVAPEQVASRITDFM